MIVLGMLIGALCFYFQDSVLWPKIHEVPVWQVLLTFLIGSTLLPLPTSYDIRGWTEMDPLNGPAWSLFYEYLANIFYALIARRLSKTLLSILVVLSGIFLVHLAFTSPNGDVIGGWSLELGQMLVGFARVSYPFLAGLLLFRVAKPIHIKNAFLVSSLLICIMLVFPRVGGSEHLWANGLNDAFNIILVFPFIVLLGAGGVIHGKVASRLCTFLGDISYPIYITHYPIIYIYTAWVANGKVPLQEVMPVGMMVFVLCIALAYACLKLYDEPVRDWLRRKLYESVLLGHKSRDDRMTISLSSNESNTGYVFKINTDIPIGFFGHKNLSVNIIDTTSIINHSIGEGYHKTDFSLGRDSMCYLVGFGFL